MSSATEILEGAAALLAEDGWCQSTAFNSEGQRCLLGGLRAAEGRLSVSQLSYEVRAYGAKLLYRALFHLGYQTRTGQVPYPLSPADRVGWALANFNDHPDTTLEDVQLLLKQAVALAHAADSAGE